MRQRRSSLAALLAWLIACTPTQLPVGANHPASAQAGAPLAPVGQALASDFDPQRAEPPTDHTHEHGDAAGSAHQHQPTGTPAGAATAPSAPGVAPDRASVWTCSMHPQVRQPKPGKCPICGMQLVPLAPAQGARQ
jgi:hypothetical protein